MKISIIVPIYNVQNLLQKSLQSILDQSYKDYEVILIDDGSTDESLKVARKFTKKDNRFRIYATSNQGLAAARNEGLKYITGPITYFMDADDQLSPNFLDIMNGYFEKHPDVEVIHFTSSQVDHQLKSINSSVLVSEEILDNKEALIRLMEVIFQPTAWSYISRSSLIKENKLVFSRGRLFEDENFNAKLLSHAHRVSVLKFNKGPYYYLVEPRKGKLMNNIMYHRTLNQLQDRLFIVKDEYSYLKKQEIVGNRYLDSWYVWKLIWIYNYYSNCKSNIPSERLKELRKQVIDIYKEKSTQLSFRQKLQYFRLKSKAFNNIMLYAKKKIHKFRKTSEKV
ncbi:glycosyltransferase family 2 protein [Limosilactobacillus sp. RRLNB_1_1]|uniref:Glycosyltransferase family 2 protein n=1 Tax=Limosilactobacillus albertensis TaxID=2759752 RepID=A0A7W3Y972_9LACO|nr:glycosyltransferase family 2 protein [Limosilactobacillus albertensis]MBB1070182.1 glycosyltransferase family 2 protein [Limosilactobacillus albertensis]MCD7119222.1 glycosyltransferase family 2 protein [Limosilactobacillus albertensis]MCD7129430.1 glycosyltransferase family 2 protein [Limosilactobacillus albertensis]